MNFLLETGNVDEAARTLRDMKPPKRYVVHINTTKSVTHDQCIARPTVTIPMGVPWEWE